MNWPLESKNRNILLWAAASCFAIFGLGGYYLSAIRPLGSCLSSPFQLIALLLGTVGFCAGTALSVGWVIWIAVDLIRHRGIARRA